MYHEDGKEINEKSPMVITVESKDATGIQDMIQKYVSKLTVDDELETFEESMDFNVETDFDTDVPLSGFEVQDMVPEYPEIDQDVEKKAVSPSLVDPSVEPNPRS